MARKQSNTSVVARECAQCNAEVVVATLQDEDAGRVSPDESSAADPSRGASQDETVRLLRGQFYLAVVHALCRT